ncbi:HesA/MoeB/ThiF family protein [Marinibactrum halimedae]|uniref:Molybdopterin-synthase adenylyltransferase n=1 Tax=Marinibactrum halimedae TaxID=1444977 RepID=A0AA37WP09_9GAMM|nr:molybdopterin-synthase adenylyltransferase MoeB [Marinibactrum halimedae]MCD9457455.1 molybdopterin-synthase adenylyltransferase MoeB [Marinibactrum halimedae]GLS25492.1 molybdopterin-synthase adenylyltransferase MoeB [Marinibactrum halimedae]
MLSDDQLLRYSRHILLPQMDVGGQEKLLGSRVLIVGLGGLGSPVAMYLAAAGVGHLVLVDHDCVDESNLQRQIVHRQSTVGQSKVDSAQASLLALNPTITVDVLNQKLSGTELAREVVASDLVLDCTDNLQTRLSINAECVAQKTPLVSAAAIGMEGQMYVFDSRVEGAPCYRCLYDESMDLSLNCAESGVLGPVVGVMGSHQALEAVKILSGITPPKTGVLHLFDGMAGQWRYLTIPQLPSCPVCRG